ncbi:glycoside hydrolase family 5 protein [Leuconostoc citreum]|jgi:aryl-phospho-beta-D-glucosidase BglC (GH1 family)|uniref:glycoside hydrolase family 5 protein n=1 Tax=Leuconostoc citreum TaxID=33964 RepID=UPI00209F9244|nr:cellulase family glycosylhydrolase [Leuconostoc citreum]MCP1275935.1 cellulase family glycosylhydrolase [Leuconostoc citreum]MDU7280990.1 cellulase family glycosylhydrolase [Leuconostoc citreum]UVW16574.1 cellulase family glycosylhydrolase [Leuconostoc citreum]
MIKGVNLGGWLVLEKWMTPQLFSNVAAEDEYYLPRDLNPETYQARIDMHRANFITEADFLRIASLGLDTVRIPVPYFIFGDVPPFQGAIDYLDKAFNWAEHYGLKILIDLHTVPGSQNGFDNGGITGVQNWSQHPEKVAFTMSVLTRLAKRYAVRTGLYGIEVLNEPATQNMHNLMMKRYKAREPELASENAPVTFEFLYQFYRQAYDQIRPILPSDKVIMFHDGFDISKWEGFFQHNTFENVVLDTHHYLMIAEIETEEITIPAYRRYMIKIGNEIEAVKQLVPIVVGEWSLFNSLATGHSTNGGINPTQVKFEETAKQKDEDVLLINRELWNLQVEQWSRVDGYFFWSYKMNIDTVNDPDWYGWDAWSLERSVNKKWAIIK